jgi:8-oxo-dGTP pyrophosphatase MutT (NUDIX family)
MKYRKGVFVVTYRKEGGKIYYLLLKRKLHWKGWEFPKGGIESKEGMKKAIAREIEEETGQIPFGIKKHGYEGKYKYGKEIRDRDEQGQTFSLYSAEVSGKEVRIDKREHSGYSWKEFGKAVKLLTWPNQRKSLRIVDKSVNR